MRRIDLRQIRLPDGWLDEASTVQGRINNRLASVDTGYDIWSKIKPLLKELSNGKCWYCEAREERSDNAVDHFRPKSIYPWFACDYENFRYSCTFCNSIRKNPETGESSGKGNHFPLLNGSPALNKTQRQTEEHVLLDPCKSSDPGFLDFTDDGRPRPKYPDQKVRNQRALASIKYYHLDHPDLNEARRQLALDIKDWVEGIDAIYSDNDQGNAAIEKAIEVLLNNIARAIDKSAPFSIFAKKMVKGYQDRPWVETLLEYV